MVKQKKTSIKNEYKVVRISNETQKLLIDLGKKNETFDEIIRRLIAQNDHR